MAIQKKKKFNPFALMVQADAILAPILGKQPISRIEATMRIWSYIKENRLQDKKRRTMIHADERLRFIFKGKDRVTMFDMVRLFNDHLRDLPKDRNRALDVPTALRSEIKSELRKIARSVKGEFGDEVGRMRPAHLSQN